MLSKREGKGRIAISHEYANAICYSGYREGQSPIEKIYPTYEEVLEDLHILSKHWRYLRMYDCGPHVETVLEVIVKEGLDFKVMLGSDMSAEVSNPNCPWGADYSDEKLTANRIKNGQEVERLIALANRYEDQVFALSVGNEASVEWTDHLVPVEQLVTYVRKIKSETQHPVTFCENYVPWANKLAPLVEELDFISIHTYPAWEYQTMETALEYTKQNYYSVASLYVDKPVVITEAGWTTASSGRGIEAWNASEELQAEYYAQLMEWTTQEKIFTFVFEAFDEPWKGSPEPLEPEKHWGLFNVDRSPKAVMKKFY